MMYLTEADRNQAMGFADIAVGNYRKDIDFSPDFQLLTKASSMRLHAESYIQRRFYESYGAIVEDYLPALLILINDNNLCGVSGIARAQTASLFLEQYLQLPVEVELQNCFNTEVSRSSIVEIGNLVSGTKGASLILFIVLACMLHRAGFKWQVFTVTTALRKNLDALGFRTRTIAAADPFYLPANNRKKWGNYYDTKPVVVAGNLDAAVALINSRERYSQLQQHYWSTIDDLAVSFNAEGQQ